MKVTRATAVATVAVIALAGTSSAATRPKPKPKPVTPVCKLIVDNAKDTFAVRSQDSEGAYGPQEDALDITSADLGSNATTLTGVVRVAKLATSVQSAPGGIDFRIQFVLPNQDPTAENFFLNARTDRSGAASFLLGLKTQLPSGAQATTAKVADATGSFDLAKSEVRISVPLSAVKSAAGGALAPGMKIQFAGLDQTSARNVVVNPATGVGTATFADVANSDKSYVAGTPTCVSIGK